jgi:hypothetical protein
MKKRTVLSVMSLGKEYHWFLLTLEGVRPIEVNYTKVIWRIDTDESPRRPVALVKHRVVKGKKELDRVVIIGTEAWLTSLLDRLEQPTPVGHDESEDWGGSPTH